jgi:4-amino-4-deoxy-L-arabinose transferase-like glycosyltransferase
MVITATQNSRLSRRLLWGLIFLYILPGLFARSPWKPEDAAGFGQSFSFVRKPWSEWAISTIGDRLYAEGGLLLAWFAGFIGKIVHFLGLPDVWLDDAMRLGNVLWFVLAGWAIWNTTYLLAKRAELQPENPLGTAPSRVDYARTVADASLLCLLSTLGLLVRAHMQQAEIAELAGISIMLLGAVRALDRPIGAGWMLGLGTTIAFFARGWTHCIPFLLFLLVSSITHPSVRFGLLRRLMRAGAVFFAVFGLWLFWALQQEQGHTWLQLWSDWNLQRFLILDPRKSLDQPTLILTLKTSAWFLWPTLPMAAWAIWRYRKAFNEVAIRIPMVAALAGFVVLIITNPADESNYFPLLPPLAVLAALGLSTMRKGLVAMIDWFSVLCFTLIAVLVWLGWTASIFGQPAKLAAKFDRLSPGYMPEVIGFELIVALIASYAWIRLIVWRTTSRNQALWRPMVLSCGGITLIWLLMMTLWMPRIDYTKSFRPVGIEVSKQVLQAQGKAACIIDYNLGYPQRSTLEYHSQMQLVRQQNLDKPKCDFLLLQVELRTGSMLQQQFDQQHGEQWKRIWTGRRNADSQEHFTLYQHTPHTLP